MKLEPGDIRYAARLRAAGNSLSVIARQLNLPLAVFVRVIDEQPELKAALEKAAATEGANNFTPAFRGKEEK